MCRNLQYFKTSPVLWFKTIYFRSLQSLSPPPSYPNSHLGNCNQKERQKNKRESTSFCFHFLDLQFSLSYFTFICVLLFLYSSFINVYFLFFRLLAFLCFILLYFLLTNDLRGAAPEPIIPNIPLTRSVNVGLIASRIHVSWWRRWSTWLLTKMEVLRYISDISDVLAIYKLLFFSVLQDTVAKSLSA